MTRLLAAAIAAAAALFSYDWQIRPEILAATFGGNVRQRRCSGVRASQREASRRRAFIRHRKRKRGTRGYR